MNSIQRLRYLMLIVLLSFCLVLSCISVSVVAKDNGYSLPPNLPPSNPPDVPDDSDDTWYSSYEDSKNDIYWVIRSFDKPDDDLTDTTETDQLTPQQKTYYYYNCNLVAKPEVTVKEAYVTDANTLEITVTDALTDESDDDSFGESDSKELIVNVLGNEYHVDSAGHVSIPVPSSVRKHVNNIQVSIKNRDGEPLTNAFVSTAENLVIPADTQDFTRNNIQEFSVSDLIRFILYRLGINL